MTKIVHAEYVRDFVLRVVFSDQSSGDYDLAPVLARDTALTRPLRQSDYFKRFFLELGALSWPNGLELSPETIRLRLGESGGLRRVHVA
jgi:hypothetical protein